MAIINMFNEFFMSSMILKRLITRIYKWWNTNPVLQICKIGWEAHTYTHTHTFPMYLLYFSYGFHSQEDTSHPPGNARVKGTRETESKAIIFLFFFVWKRLKNRNLQCVFSSCRPVIFRTAICRVCRTFWNPYLFM